MNRNYKANEKKYIYFITEKEIKSSFITVCPGKYVKIGLSYSPEDRALNLSAGNPRGLIVWKKFIGDDHTEKLMHRLFEKNKISGEWFFIDDLMIERIIKVCNARDDAEFYMLLDSWNIEIGDGYRHAFL